MITLTNKFKILTVLNSKEEATAEEITNVWIAAGFTVYINSIRVMLKELLVYWEYIKITKTVGNTYYYSLTKQGRHEIKKELDNLQKLLKTL